MWAALAQIIVMIGGRILDKVWPNKKETSEEEVKETTPQDGETK